MVGVLIRMRWRLTGRSMRNGRAAVGFWVGVVVGLLAALFTVGWIAESGHDWEQRSAIDVAATLYATWTLGWLCGPILTGSSDETLQPEHFRLLPLSYRQLATGLLAAAFVGPTAVVNLIAFSGLVVLAAESNSAAIPFAVFGAALQLIFVVLLSRVVLAWIGAAMRSRRGRDLGVLFSGVLGLSYYPLQLLISYVGPRLRHPAPAFEDMVRIVPSGWAPYSVELAATGRWWLAPLPLLGLMLVSGLLWQAWAVLLRRRLTTAAAPAGPTRTGGGSRMWSANPIGAVTIKELRTWWRDGRRRAALVPLLLLGIGMPVYLTVRHQEAVVPFAGLFVGWMGAMTCSNMFGYDGTAVWHTLVIPAAARADIRGRMTAWLILVGPLALLLSLILPGVTGRPAMYPWALSMLPVVLGVGIASATTLSVYGAFALPPQRGNPFAGGGANPGCTRALMQLSVGFGQLLVNAPVLIVLGVGAYLHNWAVQWAAFPLGALLGALAAGLGARLAEKRMNARGPELLAAVKPR